jgi:hypothetical protein
MNLFRQLDKLAGHYLDWRTEQAMKAVQASEPELVDLSVTKERGLEITLAHPGIAAMAEEAASFLKAYDATNYVQMELQPRIDRGQRPVIFTVAYKNGEMPAAKATRLEKELEELKRFTVCAYCGAQTSRTFEAVHEHILTCPDRPEMAVIKEATEQTNGLTNIINDAISWMTSVHDERPELVLPGWVFEWNNTNTEKAPE